MMGTTDGSTQRDDNIDNVLNAMTTKIAQASIARLVTLSHRFQRV
jgi:hypothetical protein